VWVGGLANVRYGRLRRRPGNPIRAIKSLLLIGIAGAFAAKAAATGLDELRASRLAAGSRLLPYARALVRMGWNYGDRYKANGRPGWP